MYSLGCAAPGPLPPRGRVMRGSGLNPWVSYSQFLVWANQFPLKTLQKRQHHDKLYYKNIANSIVNTYWTGFNQILLIMQSGSDSSSPVGIGKITRSVQPYNMSEILRPSNTTDIMQRLVPIPLPPRVKGIYWALLSTVRGLGITVSPYVWKAEPLRGQRNRNRPEVICTSYRGSRKS